MKRIKDTYLDTISSVIDFSGQSVLEIGCGDGSRSVQIAERCGRLVVAEPDEISLETAKRINSRDTIQYLQASAQELPFPDAAFDIVFFTISLHHVPLPLMSQAIDEALRVVKTDGRIVVMEPTFDGSVFECEVRFDAWDGDERKQKAYAYYTVLSHPGLHELAELHDETVFSLDSVEDFIETLHPKKGTRQEWAMFLQERNFLLNANRRINIFQKVPGTKGL